MDPRPINATDPATTPPPPPPPLMYASPRSYSSPLHPYESARPRANRVVITLWATVFVQLLFIWPFIENLRELYAIAAGDEIGEEFKAWHTVNLVGIGLNLLVVLLQIIFWMMWVHRTYRNLPALG